MSFRKLVFSLLAICMGIGNTSRAQENLPSGPIVDFVVKRHNFGKIREDINYAIYKFVCINKGNKPLYINHVQSSCGCTAPFWSKDSIPPGGEGYVEARYETKNRIGKFNKTLTVYTNAANSPYVHLDIEGEVLEDTKKNDVVSDPGFNDLGTVKFSAELLDFGDIKDNATDTQTIIVTNTSDNDVNFSLEEALPACITLSNFPKSLASQESVLVKVILDGKKIDKYGYNYKPLSFKTSHYSLPYYQINVQWTRKPYFPKYSKRQLKKQPKLQIDSTYIDFGFAKDGDILEKIFTFTNTGKKPLEFYLLKPDCSCIQIQFPKSTLLPGESMKLKAVYDLLGKEGVSTKGIRIMTNDPSNSETFIWLRATLEVKKKYCPTCPNKY